MNEWVQFLERNPSYGHVACVIAGGVLAWFGIQRMTVNPLWATLRLLSDRVDELQRGQKDMTTAIRTLAEAVSSLSGVDHALELLTKGDK